MDKEFPAAIDSREVVGIPFAERRQERIGQEARDALDDGKKVSLHTDKHTFIHMAWFKRRI